MEMLITLEKTSITVTNTTTSERLHIAHTKTTNIQEDPSMVEDITWEVAPQLIIGAVTAKTHDRNFTDCGSNISNGGPHGCRCSEYYTGFNEVLDMADLVKPNAVSLRSDNFAFMMNPNGPAKDRYIRIVSNMMELTAKGILSKNQVRTAGHFYD